MALWLLAANAIAIQLALAWFEAAEPLTIDLVENRFLILYEI